MNRLAFALLALTATPAFAAEEGPFFSLHNAEFVVTIAFIVFVGLIIYLGVPRIMARMLDDRATLIRNELDEARVLREEAKVLLHSYEAKQKDVQEQSSRIVAAAREEAQAAAAKARVDLQASIARRMAAAEDQIASAVKAAEVAVRNQAVNVSVAAASQILAAQMKADGAAASIDAAISQVGAKLH